MPEIVHLKFEDDLPEEGQLAQVYAFTPEHFGGNPLILRNPETIKCDLEMSDVGDKWTVEVMHMTRAELEALPEHEGW